MLIRKAVYSRKLIIILLVTAAVFFSSCAAGRGELPQTVWEATVTGIDKYGFATIDLTGEDLFSAGFEHGDMLAFKAGNAGFEAPFVTNLSDVDIGRELLGDPGAPNHLVLAINMGDFAEAYNISEGLPVAISLHEKAGYLDAYNLRQMTRTYDRADYASDEIFANFRMVTAGGIAPGVLYRSSSPVNNAFGRAAYANALAEQAGIVTIINLADSRMDLVRYLDAEGFSSHFYEDLFVEGRVLYLDMGIDITSDDFGYALRDALMFLAEKDAPFLIHCNEGKDRAGFTIALIEALMGADIDEIAAGYMLSFVNYYHVVPGSEQYNAVAEGTIMKTLRMIVGLDPEADLTGIDLQAAAEGYVAALGLDADYISAIKSNLSAEI